MGVVYADITLTNAVDIELARRHIIGVEEIKQVTLSMLVDSGTYMMEINESLQSQLQLPLVEKRKVQVADSRVIEFDVVGPIHIKFANRKATCNAFVLPENSEPLLGSIPMEEMDVIIHPLRQELIVNPEHPDYAVLKMK